jgi:hypothetical protein
VRYVVDISGSLQLSRLFALALAAFRAQWAPMLVAGLLLSYVPTAAPAWFVPSVEQETTAIVHPPAPSPSDVERPEPVEVGHHGHQGPWEMYIDAWPLGWFLLQFLCGAALSGALASLTISSVNQDRTPWRRAARDTASNLLPLILLGVIVTVLAAIGAIIIIPGLIAFAAWAVAGPVQIAERPGVMGSLRRSAELTRGHHLIVLAQVAVWLVAFFAFEMLPTLVPAAAGFYRLARSVYQPALGTLASVIYDVFITALYLELRRVKEGVAVGELDNVFA